MEQLRSGSSALRSSSSHGVSAPRALALVVDDEESICKTLTDVLADEHFDTIVAHDGTEALQRVKEYSPALVFLDIWMPGWDGIETLERIKEISPATEVIMMSGHATISNALEATKRGALDFIEKPFHLESVLLSANRALERRSSLVRPNAEEQKHRGQNRVGSSKALYQHPGMLTRHMAGRNLGQRTLAESAILYGHCLHSGQKSGLVLEPLPANSGIHFARMGDSKAVPAFVDFVDSTDFATTIRAGSTHASTIEHLMSALFAYGISNLLIKCNGEVPIFDGSAKEFCSVIESVGIEEQEGDWFELAVDQELVQRSEAKGVSQQGAEQISISPADELIVTYELSYPEPVGKQVFEFRFEGVESYRREIAPARTFGFMKDIERLQRAGLAAGGRLDNFILIGPDRVINTELRFPEELVRHKILDALGDLFLLGRPLRGHIRATMTGHSDNVNLLRRVRELLHAELP